jgi:regulator of sigma E protease
MILPIVTKFFYIITGILGIGFLIGFHELGHFLFAKLFGVDTPSFSIGFGPTLIQKKLGGTQFRLAAIPLGGYVEIAGAAEVGQGEQKEASRRDSRSFAAKPYYQKMLILFGGILFNLMFAYLALILLFSVGVPQTALLYPLNANTTIKSIDPESVAQKFGLKPGDTIVNFNNIPLKGNAVRLLEEIQAMPECEIPVTIEREGQLQILNVKLAPEDKANRKRLGITLESKDFPPQSFSESVKAGISKTNQLIKLTVLGVISIFKRFSTEGMGGPVMIIDQISKGAQRGFKVWLLLLVLISINLAILNLVPLPVVDGGQILFYTIEALAGRPLPENVRMGIHYASWILLLALVIYLSIKDLGVIIHKAQV